jgi:hypothetical protein
MKRLAKRDRSLRSTGLEGLEDRNAPSTSAFGSSLIGVTGSLAAFGVTATQTTANPGVAGALTGGFGIGLGGTSSAGGQSNVGVSATGFDPAAVTFTNALSMSSPIGSITITVGIGAAII